MKATKEELIRFLEDKVLVPVENHPKATATIKKKIHGTRMRLNEQVSAEKVEQFYYTAMSTERGKDSYQKIKDIGGPTFEDVVDEFKKLCGREY
ncbi:hypothetical protein GN157_12860 [Flavobacterium rakeshii]|uniref:Uncharacterized protein n=1 Tax=Flavobacterium rakeshii TaxID=1038845 RepID=A0A6N8HFZ3_9FLAO|nr:hypothetical protein [Flavobacterium rakeshii]MUV04600.1 hypothetical protein [Flavobacterium rakeshii]